MNIKSILITAFLLIAFAVTSQAQYTVVRVIEGYKDKDSQIQIVHDNGETEIVELSKITTTIGARLKTDNSLENIKLIAETLNKIKSKGYKLIGSSTGAGGVGDAAHFAMQTYIFEKED